MDCTTSITHLNYNSSCRISCTLLCLTAEPFPALATACSQLSTGKHTLTLLPGTACRSHPVAKELIYQQTSTNFSGNLRQGALSLNWCAKKTSVSLVKTFPSLCRYETQGKRWERETISKATAHIKVACPRE